jgi:hypothetical protein
MRILKEKTHREAMRTNSVSANPIDNIAKARTRKAKVIGTRLSYRATNHPDIGRPINELIGMNKRIVPNSASLNPKKLFIVGIRDAQLEKQIPERKKKTLKKIRCLLFESIPPEFGVKLEN